MKYEDARRSSGVESAWLRLKLWFHSSHGHTKPTWGDLRYLSDHERRDIGIPEPLRYMDWRALKDRDWP